MFNKLIVVFIFAIFGLLVTLILSSGEQFAEKALPVLTLGGVIVALVLAWFFGYFLSSQKPPHLLTAMLLIALILSFVSGLYMGRG